MIDFMLSVFLFIIIGFWWVVMGYFGGVLGMLLDMLAFGNHDKYAHVPRWKFFLGISMGPFAFIWPAILALILLFRYLRSGHLWQWLKEDVGL